MPEDSSSSKPLRRSSCCTSEYSSSTRGSITSASVWRDSCARRALAHAGHLDHVVGVGELAQRAAVA